MFYNVLWNILLNVILYILSYNHNRQHAYSTKRQEGYLPIPLPR